MASGEELLEQLYRSFNARHVEGALATMHPDVVWANDLEGGNVYGYQGVRDYWERQWDMIDTRAEPIRYWGDRDGVIDVEVRLTARDVNGDLVYDNVGHHVFWIENGLIKRFEVVIKTGTRADR
jgi:ketosteroid isomerase-like protein